MSKKSNKKVTSNLVSNFFKNKLAVLFSLLTLLLGFLGGTSYLRYTSKTDQYPQKAKVQRIIDGDTLELDNGQEFRLYGINCPEQGKPYYQEAKDFTQDKVLNKKVNLEYEDNYKKDSYQRLLGYVFINDANLNVELVKNGLCQVVLYSKRAKLTYQDELVEAENEAKQSQLRLWEN